MRDIAIYGAGGLGREVASMILMYKEHYNWNFIGFFDDGKRIGEDVSHFGKVLGGIDELNNWNKRLDIVLAFGAPKTLSLIHNKIINKLIDFPNIIHPSFYISDEVSCEFGIGNIIQKNCTISVENRLGNFNLFNGDVIIGHDTKIGNYNVFMPGVKISGEVQIGDNNLFGSGCFVKQQLKIGDGVTLSPLSALLSRPKDGQLYIGNPAKQFKI